MFNQNNQNKPPAFPLLQPSPQQMNEYNWSINNMPWKSSNENSSNAVVLFNGLSLNNNVPPVPTPSTSGFFIRQPRVKRKSESDDLIPSKQFISEEKMIAHMNGLHLSDNYQKPNEEVKEPEIVSKMGSYNVNLTPQELEQRLKKAQRIVVCDKVMKSLKEDHEIIPKVLLNRIEEPCRALVLWKPPENLDQLLTGYSDEEEIDMDGNNNNNNNDPNNNNNMDMDM